MSGRLSPKLSGPRPAGERGRLGPLPGGQMCGTSRRSRARGEGIPADDSASATPGSAGVQSQTVTSPRGASNQPLPERFCSPSPEPETLDEVPRGTKIPFGCGSCPKRSIQEWRPSPGGFRVLHRCSGTEDEFRDRSLNVCPGPRATPGPWAGDAGVMT